MSGKIVAALLAVGCLALTALPANAQEVAGVAVNNFTKFTPVARDVVVPAGETIRFNLDARNYGRVSLLIAGETRPEAGPIGLLTLFGPPLVPASGPRPLPVSENGRIAVSFVEPVQGPAMVIAIHNDSAAAARLTISAYLAN
jgi:hypothetical protein